MRYSAVIAAALFLLTLSAADASYAQIYDDEEDNETSGVLAEKNLEESELFSEQGREASEISRGLESNMMRDEAEGEKDMEEMDESMRGNETPLGVADYE